MDGRGQSLEGDPLLSPYRKKFLSSEGSKEKGINEYLMQLFASRKDVKSQTTFIRFVYSVYLTPYSSQLFRYNE